MTIDSVLYRVYGLMPFVKTIANYREFLFAVKITRVYGIGGVEEET